ncbi:MAG: VOC family protein, partial [Promethearchaeota archaeon]
PDQCQFIPPTLLRSDQWVFLANSYKNRWAQFRICDHFTLGLLCPAFDKAIIESGQDLSPHYDIEFIHNFTDEIIQGNNVVLNLSTTDIKNEYERIKALGPKKVSNIMYVNFMYPYRFFHVEDPDGNVIEIAES